MASGQSFIKFQLIKSQKKITIASFNDFFNFMAGNRFEKEEKNMSTRDRLVLSGDYLLI